MNYSKRTVVVNKLSETLKGNLFTADNMMYNTEEIMEKSTIPTAITEATLSILNLIYQLMHLYIQQC
jgi:hypothetical protein